MRWLVASACLGAWRPASAELVAAAVLPHGDFAYDPSLLRNASARGKAERLREASRAAGAFIREARPEVVFLTSPHGLELTRDFLLYENPVLSGAAELGGDLGPNASTYNVSLTVATHPVVAELLAALRARGAAVSGIQGFAESLPLPISWGEVLPLSFLDSAGAGPQNFKVVVMGIPYRRYTEDFAMVDELSKLGGLIADFFARSKRRVAWVVSADLAHTHLASGPYGYCACAAPFDAAVGRWLQSLHSVHLTEEATRQERAGAKSCGYTGLLMLDGALGRLGRDAWRPSLLALEAPTYYGMGVATFAPAAGSTFV
mmetsp:Transcript_47506/g.144288  ORF Transcript_47506/g.144288 Transcript_47506/m.144288 type:complete len:317 (-) Transcript_47506:52-1002(-)